MKILDLDRCAAAVPTIFVAAFLLVSASVSRGQDAPQLLSVPPFVLSPEAAAAGISGTVMLDVSITKNGDVKGARVLAGPAWPCKGKRPGREIEIVHEAVRKTIRAAKFAQPMKDGKPADIEVLLTVALELQNPLPALRQGGMIESGVINGKALSLPKPPYPAEARTKRLTGPVAVRVIIDEQGSVYSAGVVKGLPAFHDSVREAACNAKFAPIQLSGVPICVTGVITYVFAGPR